jgi:hypothetical protein
MLQKKKAEASKAVGEPAEETEGGVVSPFEKRKKGKKETPKKKRASKRREACGSIKRGTAAPKKKLPFFQP